MMVISVDNLVKRYKELVALDHFEMDVRQGEILGLLGPNGSGKTTAINCMLALLTYDKGDIQLFEQPMTPHSYDLKRRIGVVPQEVAVMENLTVAENIDYFCGLYIDKPSERKRLVEEAITFVGLDSHRKFLPKKLSGGLKRRLNIACGIVHQPELIFMDEPTVAVDAQSRHFILEGIKKLNKAGSTIVYTSHYLEEVELLCSRIIIMDKGQNIAQGTKEELTDMIDVGDKVVVTFSFLSDEQKAAMYQLPNVMEVEQKEEEYHLLFKRKANNLSYFLEWISQQGLTYSKLYSEKPSLNDVFLALTGKELRDE